MFNSAFTLEVRSSECCLPFSGTNVKERALYDLIVDLQKSDIVLIFVCLVARERTNVKSDTKCHA